MFHEHRVGYEAALVVAGIATHETDAAWAERAVERTIVHLKEEVKAAGLVSRVEQREHVEPPDDALVLGLRALEARVVTGAVFTDASAGAGLVTLCTWCHLEGVHRGRFTVTRENGVLVWRFGNHTVVAGRRRIRTATHFAAARG